VLTFIARLGKVRAIDIAPLLGITERSVRRIIAELVAEGYIDVRREGSVNRYKLNKNLPLRRSESREIKVKELLSVFTPHRKDKQKLDS
jgi:Mn-dependent DtxR family transcriptional regulator